MIDPNAATGLVRFAPELPLPAYSYVPGKHPHPISDPRGHSYGQPLLEPLPPTSEDWHESQPFCFAVDLFNRGYYWEAHEVWESLWKAWGRRGTVADFLKALIKLAAAGVKAREGRPTGWQRHLRRALELVEKTIERLGPAEPRYFGLSLAELASAIRLAIQSGPPADSAEDAAVRDVFPFQLLPRR